MRPVVGPGGGGRPRDGTEGAAEVEESLAGTGGPEISLIIGGGGTSLIEAAVFSLSGLSPFDGAPGTALEGVALSVLLGGGGGSARLGMLGGDVVLGFVSLFNKEREMLTCVRLY